MKISSFFLTVAMQMSVVTLTVHAQVPDNGSPSRANSFTGTKAGEERAVVGIKLCWCPAGKFIMGSPPTEPEWRSGDDHPVEVTLTKGFWMAKYEATQGQWKRVMGSAGATHG